LCPLCDNAEKYGKARQTTDGNITEGMLNTYLFTKATDTYSECDTLIAFPGQ